MSSEKHVESEESRPFWVFAVWFLAFAFALIIIGMVMI